MYEREQLPVSELEADVIVVGSGSGGLSAALAVKEGILPRDVDVSRIRAILRERGAIIDKLE